RDGPVPTLPQHISHRPVHSGLRGGELDRIHPPHGTLRPGPVRGVRRRARAARSARDAASAMSRPPTLAERVRFFVPAFEVGRAPLYLYLTMRAAVELERPTQAFTMALQPFVGEPPERFLWLRLLALVHRWVLAGELPELAGYYPSAGGAMGPAG